jgi:hypothetical protein
VNGARGVIINVTGGPDLSLVEVSEASSIVQEAADEDANIIFGAVVDPALKGKVKITVIATGFGGYAAAKPAASTAATPVDMTNYTDQARGRTEPVAPPAPAAAGSRLTIARRPLLDVAPATATPAPKITSAVPADDPDLMRPAAASDRLTAATNPDFDLGSTFDVPAFLRRHEG